MQSPVMVFCRLSQPATMADLSEVALPTRFVFLALGPEDDGPNAIWELSEMGRSLGSMLGDKVLQTCQQLSRSTRFHYKPKQVNKCVFSSKTRQYNHTPHSYSTPVRRRRHIWQRLSNNSCIMSRQQTTMSTTTYETETPQRVRITFCFFPKLSRFNGLILATF